MRTGKHGDPHLAHHPACRKADNHSDNCIDETTLGVVDVLRDAAAVCRDAVMKGDADVAIEMLRRADRQVAKALGHYNIARPGDALGLDLVERVESPTEALPLKPVDRGRLLELATEATARGAAYGAASELNERVAALWSALLGWPVKPTDVIACMVALKLARIIACPGHVDSWADVAGYAAVGAEVATTPPPGEP